MEENNQTRHQARPVDPLGLVSSWTAINKQPSRRPSTISTATTTRSTDASPISASNTKATTSEEPLAANSQPTTSIKTNTIPTALMQTLTSPQTPQAFQDEETDLVYKHRLNSDMAALFRDASPATSPQTTAGPPASIKGIGLYTHIEGPRSNKRPLFPHQRYTKAVGDPVFLPLGGPAGGKFSRNQGESSGTGTETKGDGAPPLSEKVRKVWEEMRAAILEEEVIIKKMEVKAQEEEDLCNRYGALDKPRVPLLGGLRDAALWESGADKAKQDVVMGGTESMERRQSKDSVMAGQEEWRRSSTSSVLPAVESRRSSAHSLPGIPDEDATMSDTGPRKKPKANSYDESRDPRRRGRK